MLVVYLLIVVLESSGKLVVITAYNPVRLSFISHFNTPDIVR